LSSTVVAFGPRRPAPDRFTKTDRTALIALGYALGGSWRTDIEVDEDGEWAAICPRNGDLALTYLVLVDGTGLELIDDAMCRLGTFDSADDLAAEVRRQQGRRAPATLLGTTRHGSG
jgi:hypothetical protein